METRTATRKGAAAQAAGSTTTHTAANPKQVAFTLTDPAGNRLRLVASLKKSGRYVVRAFYKSKDGNRKMRGMTATVEGIEAARAELSKIQKQAEGAGWAVKTRSVGAKADDFSAIPAAAKK